MDQDRHPHLDHPHRRLIGQQVHLFIIKEKGRHIGVKIEHIGDRGSRKVPSWTTTAIGPLLPVVGGHSMYWLIESVAISLQARRPMAGSWHAPACSCSIPFFFFLVNNRFVFFRPCTRTILAGTPTTVTSLGTSGDDDSSCSDLGLGSDFHRADDLGMSGDQGSFTYRGMAFADILSCSPRVTPW